MLSPVVAVVFAAVTCNTCDPSGGEINLTGRAVVRDSDQPRSRVTLVFFLGGVTYTELSALRYEVPAVLLCLVCTLCVF